MKKRNRILALLLSLAMMLTFMPALAFAESPADGPAGDAEAAAAAEVQEDGSDEAEKPAAMRSSGLGIRDEDPDDGNENDDPDDQEKPDVSVDLNVGDGILINDWFWYSAEAVGEDAGMVDYIEVYADYDGGDADWGMSRRSDGGYIDARDQRMWYENEGTYTFAAAAWAYGGEGEEDELLALATQPVIVEKKGSIGGFTITGLRVNGKDKGLGTETAPLRIDQGDKLDITCSDADKAEHYWIDAQNRNGDGWDYYDHLADTGEPSLYLNTIELTEGIYKLSVGANAPGYDSGNTGNEIFLEVRGMDDPEGGIYFAVSKGTKEADPLDTCEELEYEVYSPDADRIVVYPGWPGQWWRDENSGRAALSGTASYDESGRYTLRAVAYAEDNEIGSSEIEVYVEASKGESLAVSMPDEVPSYIAAGSGDVEFEVAVPENAEGVSAIARFERDDFEGNDELFADEAYADEEDVLKVKFGTDGLEPGDTVIIELSAWGTGYDAARADARIPVVTGAPSKEVEMTVDKNDVLVNEDVRATVTAAGNKKIDCVQFFDGYGFRGEEDLDGGEDSFEQEFSFGDEGTFSVLALVKLRGSGEWVTTNAETVNATSNGSVSPFDITGFSVNGVEKNLKDNSEENPFTMTRGDDITIECEKSENADHYWADADRLETDEESGDSWWHDNWDDFGHSDDGTVSFNTLEFEPGLYRLRTKANGLGYESEEADTWVYVEVLDIEIPEGGMLFEVSKGTDEGDPLATCEEASFKAYCPGADWIEIFWDAEGNDDWRGDNHGGDAWADSFSYDEAGTFTLRAVAYAEGEGGDEGEGEDEGEDGDGPQIICSAEMPVFVTASEGGYSFEVNDVPAYIEEGSLAVQLHVTLPVDENGKAAEGGNVNVWWDYQGDDEDIREMVDSDDFEDDLYNEEFSEADFDDGILTFTFSPKEVPADSVIRVRVEARGYDHDKASEEAAFPVIAEPDDDVKITAAGTEIPVNKSMMFKVTAASVIEKVRFFNGNDLEDEEEPDGKDNTKYYREHGFGEAGKHAVFAKVKLAGEDSWLTTEPVVITATAAGAAGPFEITGISVDGKEQADLSSVKVTQGEILAIEHSASEHADHYWADMEEYRENDEGEWRWEWYDRMADTNRDDVLTLGTADLEPGEYRLIVKADAENYEEAEAGMITLTVEQYEGAKDELSFTVPGTETSGGKTTLSLQAGEDFTFSAICPDACYIRVYMDYGYDNSWSSDNLDYDRENEEYIARPGYSRSENYSWAGETLTATYRLRAVAYGTPTGEPHSDDFTDGAIIDEKEIEVTVTAAGSIDIDESELPEDVYECGLSFTATLPEHADGVQVRACYPNDPDDWEDDEVIYREVSRSGKLDVEIPADALKAGENLELRIYAWGLGYNEDAEYGYYTIKAHEGFGETAYVWSEDNSTVTATRVCTKNPAHVETETVETSSEQVDSTCTEDGITRYTSDEFENPAFEVQTKDVAIGKKGHRSGEKQKENEVAATCTGTGSYDEVVYCTVCNAELSRTKKTVPALGHSWGEWKTTVAPTELAPGKKVRSCSRGHVEEAAVAQLKPTLAAVKIAKPAAGKKSVTVKWKKIAKKKLKKTKKVQIQIATDKKFTKGVKTKYASAKKTSLVIKGLKSKKKYFVRVRAYTKSGKTVHVSKWSAVKSFKAK